MNKLEPTPIPTLARGLERELRRNLSTRISKEGERIAQRGKQSRSLKRIRRLIIDDNRRVYGDALVLIREEKRLIIVGHLEPRDDDTGLALRFKFIQFRRTSGLEFEYAELALFTKHLTQRIFQRSEQNAMLLMRDAAIKIVTGVALLKTFTDGQEVRILVPDAGMFFGSWNTEERLIILKTFVDIDRLGGNQIRTANFN